MSPERSQLQSGLSDKGETVIVIPFPTLARMTRALWEEKLMGRDC